MGQEVNLNQSPAFRRQRAKLAGIATAIRNPDRGYTVAGLEAIRRKYYDATDPSLSEEERVAQARELERQHLREVSARGVLTRTKRRLEREAKRQAAAGGGE